MKLLDVLIDRMKYCFYRSYHMCFFIIIDLREKGYTCHQLIKASLHDLLNVRQYSKALKVMRPHFGPSFMHKLLSSYSKFQ